VSLSSAMAEHGDLACSVKTEIMSSGAFDNFVKGI